MLFKKKKNKVGYKIKKTCLQITACNQVLYNLQKKLQLEIAAGGSFSLRFKLIGAVAVPPPLSLRSKLSHGCGAL